MSTPKQLLQAVLCIAVLVSLVNSCILPGKKVTDGKVFLIGGSTSDDTSSIYNALRESTGKPNPSIAVVISAAPSLADGLDAYYVPEPDSTSYELLFQTYGFTPSVVRLAQDNYLDARTSDTELGRENIELIRNADVLFFNGGDQSRHSRSWLHDDGEDSEIMVRLRSRFLAREVVIAGTSAGAAAQGNTTYGEGVSYGYFKYGADLKACAIGETFRDDREGTNSERYEINGGFMRGFAFLENVLVDTHFDARGRFVRLAAAIKNMKTTFGFGVEEDTALYVDGNIATAYGNGGVWWMDESRAVYPIGEHFMADFLLVSYLTDGDSINFSNLTISSTKELIVDPFGPSYDTKDIFASQEAVTVIRNLVSSNDYSSSNWSKEKNPGCRVIFYKKIGETVGYRSGEKYTIDKLGLDIESL